MKDKSCENCGNYNGYCLVLTWKGRHQCVDDGYRGWKPIPPPKDETIEDEIAINLECIQEDNKCTGKNGHCPFHCNGKDKATVFLTVSQFHAHGLYRLKDVEIDEDKMKDMVQHIICKSGMEITDIIDPQKRGDILDKLTQEFSKEIIELNPIKPKEKGVGG